MVDRGIPPGPIRARVLRLRRRAGRTRPGRALKRALGRERAIPARTEPHRAGLLSFPSDERLPPELGDGRILDDAVAWRERALSLRRRGSRCEPGDGAADRSPAGSVNRLRNVVLVSHCDFGGNSALHVYAIARELERRGLSPLIAVPVDPEGVDDLGRPSFPVLSYAQALEGPLRFPTAAGPTSCMPSRLASSSGT